MLKIMVGEIDRIREWIMGSLYTGRILFLNMFFLTHFKRGKGEGEKEKEKHP